MFSGYPGEGVAELEATRSLLLQHESHIDRVHFSRFSAQHGTPITERLLAEPERFPDLRIRQDGPRSECLAHTDRRIDRWAYRRAVGRLLRVVTRINRGPLREAALELEGAM
jgi:tRNA A37 methylthiotransferase MiaB